jgi:hypothetical protein
MESQFEQHENIIKPEGMNDIRLLEVLESDERHEDALVIYAKPDQSPEEVESILKKQLVDKNWWLQEYWQSKSVQEQIVIKFGESEISVYNYGESLKQEQIQSIESILQSFSTLKKSNALKNINAILIDDIQGVNQNTGEDLNGYGALDKGLKLYPNSLKPIDHRVANVSNLEGTVIHELSHGIGENIEQQWRKEFGWKPRENREKMTGDAYSYEYTVAPENCVTDYARINAKEDLCESMVAALKNPEILDPARLKFIRSELLGQDPTVPTSDFETKNGDKITFPRLEQPVRYIRKQPTIKWKSLE